MLPVPYTHTSDSADTEILHRPHGDEDAAFDLRAAHDAELPPGGRDLIKTGLRIAIPKGYAGLVLPRSGLALDFGVTVLNAPGLIDPGYRGEIGVILWNSNHVRRHDIKEGDRIAQLLFVAVPDLAPLFHPGSAFDVWTGTGRGEGGFGSTGR